MSDHIVSYITFPSFSFINASGSFTQSEWFTFRDKIKKVRIQPHFFVSLKIM